MRHQDERAPRRGWHQWSEAQARAMLSAFARSGLSAAAFAKSRGVSAQRLRYWTRHLAEEARVEFLPVSLPVPIPPHAAVIEIAVGDVVVRVREGLDVEHVARLVVALAGRPSC